MLYSIEGAVDGVLNIDPIYGGESYQFTITAENLANVDIEVEAKNILRNENGLTCADIESASVDASSTEGWSTTLNLEKPGFSCESNGQKEIRPRRESNPGYVRDRDVS